jgi:uncharacterized protein YjbJ (UPF0337 family)
MMDWNRVEGNWKEVKGKIKEQWGKLTDDDLDVIAGKQDQLEGKIQQRYGGCRNDLCKRTYEPTHFSMAVETEARRDNAGSKKVAEPPRGETASMARFLLTAPLLPKPRRAAPTAPANLSSLMPPPRSSLTTSTPSAAMAVTALDENERTFAPSDLVGSNWHT